MYPVTGSDTILIAFIFVFTLMLLVFVWPRLGLYVILALVIFTPDIVLGQIGYRRFYLRVDDFVLMAIVARLFVSRKLSIRLMLYNRWLFYALAFLCIAIISSLVAIFVYHRNMLLTVLYVAKMGQYILWSICAVVLLRKPSHLRIFTWAMLITLIFLGLWIMNPVIGYEPHGGLMPLPFDPAGIQQSGVFAGMFTIIMIALLMEQAYGRSKIMLVCTIIAMLACVVLLGASGGRGGVVGTVAGLFVMLFIVMHMQRIRRRAVVLVISIIMSTFVLFLWLQKTAAFESGIRRIFMSSNLLLVSSDTSLIRRFTSWPYLLKIGLNRPVIGHGIATYEWFDNWYIRLWVETGIVGVIIWVKLMYELLRQIARGMQCAHPLIRAYSLGSVGVLVEMSIASIFAEQFMTVRTAEPFWILIGAAIAGSLTTRQFSSEVRKMLKVRR